MSDTFLFTSESGRAGRRDTSKAVVDFQGVSRRVSQGVDEGSRLDLEREAGDQGHFGREQPEFTWERTDKAQALAADC